MQPRPNDRNQPIVDPRPGKKKIMIPKPNPRATKKPPRPGFGTKPGRGSGPKPYPMPRVQPVDDKIVDTMPITRKQLNGIKKMYGI